MNVRAVSIASAILLISLLLTGCSGQAGILLISDPYYEEVLLTDDHLGELREGADRAGQGFRTILYDQADQTGTFSRELQGSTAKVVLLSPMLSSEYALKKDDRLSGELASLQEKGAKLAAWVEATEAQKAEELSLSYGDIYLVYDIHEGWDDADTLLHGLYEDLHRVGVIYNRSAFGYTAAPEELLPLLFSDLENRPELITVDGASITDAKGKDAVSRLAGKGVEIVCVMGGADSVNVVRNLEEGGMLAIIEGGEYLPGSRESLYGSISIDYKGIGDRLPGASINARDEIQFIRSTRVFVPY